MRIPAIYQIVGAAILAGLIIGGTIFALRSSEPSANQGALNPSYHSLEVIGPPWHPSPGPITTIAGYHTTLVQGEELSTTTYNCDGFVVTDGDRILLANLREIIREGNSVNSLTSEGFLEMPTKLDALSSSSQRLVLQSTPREPVQLTVQQKAADGKEVRRCDGLVTILGASELTASASSRANH